MNNDDDDTIKFLWCFFFIQGFRPRMHDDLVCHRERYDYDIHFFGEKILMAIPYGCDVYCRNPLFLD